MEAAEGGEGRRALGVRMELWEVLRYRRRAVAVGGPLEFGLREAALRVRGVLGPPLLLWRLRLWLRSFAECLQVGDEELRAHLRELVEPTPRAAAIEQQFDQAASRQRKA